MSVHIIHDWRLFFGCLDQPVEELLTSVDHQASASQPGNVTLYVPIFLQMENFKRMLNSVFATQVFSYKSNKSHPVGIMIRFFCVKHLAKRSWTRAMKTSIAPFATWTPRRVHATWPQVTYQIPREHTQCDLTLHLQVISISSTFLVSQTKENIDLIHKVCFIAWLCT